MWVTSWRQLYIEHRIALLVAYYWCGWTFGVQCSCKYCIAELMAVRNRNGWSATRPRYVVSQARKDTKRRLLYLYVTMDINLLRQRNVLVLGQGIRVLVSWLARAGENFDLICSWPGIGILKPGRQKELKTSRARRTRGALLFPLLAIFAEYGVLVMVLGAVSWCRKVF